MTEFNIKLAGHIFGVTVRFEGTKRFCGQFICDEEPCESICLTENDIQAEKTFSPDASMEVLELQALHRKVTHSLIEYDTVLFHGSAVSLNGEGYIFTAPSGTGKSTHAEKWNRLFGAVYVNDDKPFIKAGEVSVVCGSPWMGEHDLGQNVSVPIKAVCVLEKNRKNRIEEIPPEDGFSELIKQTYIPKDKNKAKKTLHLLFALSRAVKVYKLYCNEDDESAKIALSGIKQSIYSN